MESQDQRAKECAMRISAEMGLYGGDEKQYLQKAYVWGAEDQIEIDNQKLDAMVANLVSGKLPDERAIWIDRAAEWIEANMEKFTWDDYETDPKGMAEAFKNFMGGGNSL